MKAFQATPLVWLVSREREREGREEEEEDIDQFKVWWAQEEYEYEWKDDTKAEIATTTDAYTATTPG